MIFFFQPLLQENNDKHGGHNKADAGSIKFKQSAGKAADCRAGNPVNIIKQRYKEEEPASVHMFRNRGGIIDGKGFIAHAENQKKLFPSQPLIFFQH